MSYKVFISHSTRDQGLVVALAQRFVKLGIDVYVAEWYLTPGQPISRKVFNQIKAADCVVAFLTPSGQRSNWVQQEIGYALGLRKLVIPLVERGTTHRELAALGDVECIEYDPAWPQQALDRASGYVNSLKLKKTEREKALLVTGGILAFLLLLSADTK